MTIQLNGDTGISTPMYGGSIASNPVTPSVNFKNRIINGAMVIDQRNAGASINNSTSGLYSVDRWKTYGAVSAKFSIQQNAGSVTPPVGFPKYVGVTSLAATTPASSDQYDLYQLIEGYNIADLGWGTANAKTVTLSFWVRSSLTGTFGGVLKNTAANRSYPYSYTVSSANTWEQKSITVVGETTGTWETTTSTGIIVLFSLGSGSSLQGTAGAWASANYVAPTGITQIVGTSGATFYITGVQLEVGSTASSFDYRSYGTELALCQRYYEKSYAINTKPGTVTPAATTISTFPAAYATYFNCTFQASKRTAPTMTAYSPVTGAAGFQSENMATDYAIAAFIANGVNQACAYTSRSVNSSNYMHFTADAEL